MNREIKFRGKMLDNGEWVYGSYVYNPEWNIHYICHPYDFYKFDRYRVDRYSVGQFTGLKDKNGVEVYEGDYLLDRWEEEEGEIFVNRSPVVWDNENMQWAIDASFRQDGSFLVPIVEYFGNDIEVSGNRFENPEMIEQ